MERLKRFRKRFRSFRKTAKTVMFHLTRVLAMFLLIDIGLIFWRIVQWGIIYGDWFKLIFFSVAEMPVVALIELLGIGLCLFFLSSIEHAPTCEECSNYSQKLAQCALNTLLRDASLTLLLTETTNENALVRRTFQLTANVHKSGRENQ